jgi:hypothetical protein
LEVKDLEEVAGEVRAEVVEVVREVGVEEVMRAGEAMGVGVEEVRVEGVAMAQVGVEVVVAVVVEERGWEMGATAMVLGKVVAAWGWGRAVQGLVARVAMKQHWAQMENPPGGDLALLPGCMLRPHLLPPHTPATQAGSAVTAACCKLHMQAACQRPGISGNSARYVGKSFTAQQHSANAPSTNTLVLSSVGSSITAQLLIAHPAQTGCQNG